MQSLYAMTIFIFSFRPTRTIYSGKQNLEIMVYKRTLTKYSEIWTLQTTSCYWMKTASQQLDMLLFKGNCIYDGT